MTKATLLIETLVSFKLQFTATLLGLLTLSISGLGLAAPAITLQEIASGFQTPVELVNSGDGSGRLFVVEQGGTIKVLSGGVVAATPFLDISTVITSGGERGLLGLAFHPQYSSNRAFYVYYTRAGDGALTIARYLRSATNPLIADPASGSVVLVIPHPNYQNHNGGHLAFGPDGYLYIGTGDGGGGGDPDQNGQKLTTRLAKMLRISVNGGTGYTIPPTNPYASSNCDTAANPCPEIWAFGLRNPWKFSFDRSNGDLFIGDVGQGLYEEVNYLPAGSPGGKNFGWNVYEGTRCYAATTCSIAPGLAPHTPPIIEYGHDNTDFGGFSITGGYRYRGSKSPALNGYYFYGDFSSQRIWVATPNANGVWTREFSQIAPSSISSFGEDEAGELYLVGYGTGKIYSIKGPPAPVSVVNDLNGDGKSDIVIQTVGASATTTTTWLMNGTSISAAANILTTDPAWTISHIADFNGDGKADILWRNSNGAVTLWLMNGSTVVSTVGLLGPDPLWRVSHVGDFNGDGKSDLLWRNTSGAVTVWLMNGTAIASSAGILGADASWSVSHVGDFDGDGKGDLLWRNTNGAVTMWLMNGISISSSIGLLGANPNWSVSHTADFNGDGKADLLWRNTNGAVTMWLMNGVAVANAVGILGADANWSVTNAGDFNGDGKADLLWRNTNGAVTMWIMNGAALTSSAGLIGPDPNWRVSHIADLNGDGKADLIWRNINGAITAWLMNGITTSLATGIAGPGSSRVVP
jgi:glucose/arabinose dehydrogenase